MSILAITSCDMTDNICESRSRGSRLSLDSPTSPRGLVGTNSAQPLLRRHRGLVGIVDYTRNKPITCISRTATLRCQLYVSVCKHVSKSFLIWSNFGDKQCYATKEHEVYRVKQVPLECCEESSVFPVVFDEL